MLRILLIFSDRVGNGFFKRHMIVRPKIMQYFFIKPFYHSSHDLDQAKIRYGSQIRDTDENRKVALKNRYNRYNRYTFTEL